MKKTTFREGLAWASVLVAGLVATPAPAAAQEMFAGYDSFCGLPVVVGPDPMIASARMDGSGNPIIHVSPGVMNNWTMSRIFALAHECGHHRLGHTTNLGVYERFLGATRPQELAADCWAAQALRRAGYTWEITRTVIEQASQGQFTSGPYPSGSERAFAIASCSGGGAALVTRVPCTHPAHELGDQVPCSHVGPAHRFDVVPCMHFCGFGPCHSYGDQVPCQHPVPMHRFDLVTCQHRAHPEGDLR